MATIASLAVRLSLDSANFSTGLGRVSKEFRGFAAKAAALRSTGAAITDAVRTPMERYRHTVREVNGLLRAGVISHQTYGRAVRQSQMEAAQAISQGARGSIMFGAAAVAGVGAVLGMGVKIAADFEQTEVAFTTMLGSAEKAKSLLADLTNFAAKTPFEFPEILDSTKKLLAYGVAQEEIVSTMKMLGDLASGVGAPVSQLAFLFGQSKVEGRAMTKDLRQWLNAGIDIMPGLAKQFGVTKEEIFGLASEGKIHFSHLQTALMELTSGGGRFHNMMANMAGKVSQLWSNLRDVIGFALRDIGFAVIDAIDLRGLLASMIDFSTRASASIVPMIQALGRWISENKTLALSLVGIVTGGAAMLLFLPRIVGTFHAIKDVIRGAILTVKALAAAFSFVAAHPIFLLIGGIAAVGAVLGTLGYSFVKATQENKSFADSFYETLHAIGLVKDEFLDAEKLIRQADDLGKRAEEAQSMADRSNSAATQIERQKIVVDLLRQRLDLIRKQETMTGVAHHDLGVAAQELQAAQNQLAKLQDTTGDNPAKVVAEMMKAAEEASKSAMQNATKDAADAQADRTNAVRETISALQEQVATFGMTESAIGLYRLAMQGATTDELRNAAALYQQLDAMQQQEDLRNVGPVPAVGMESFHIADLIAQRNTADEPMEDVKQNTKDTADQLIEANVNLDRLVAAVQNPFQLLNTFN